MPDKHTQDGWNRSIFAPTGPQTPAEQDADLEDARALLSCTALTADRCRHESVTATVLWVFDEGRQVACVKRDIDGRYPWHATRMARGEPVAIRPEDSLLKALAWVVKYCH